MYQDNIVLCGASSYEQKYYFNQDFASLPEAVKQELQIMCVLFTEDVGGISTFPIFHCIFMDQSSTVSAFFLSSSSGISPRKNTL